MQAGREPAGPEPVEVGRRDHDDGVLAMDRDPLGSSGYGAPEAKASGRGWVLGVAPRPELIILSPLDSLPERSRVTLSRRSGFTPANRGRGPDGPIEILNASSCQTKAPHRHPDLPGDPRRGLLLRRQDELPAAAAGRGEALLPLAPQTLWEEPLPGHPQGVVRGRRGALPRPGHPPRLGLVGAPSGAPAEFRGRQLRGARRPAREPHGAARRRGATDGRGLGVPHRARAVRGAGRGAPPQGRTTGRGAGRRVRQAHPGRARSAGDGSRQPRFPARRLRSDQGTPTRTSGSVSSPE